ncbi:MAG TPA: hypothetical protein VMV33_03600 [Rhodocyclaceae bacterium]|nr:hypothetical protein [Rhodocyclaceae bacterium]
MKMHGHGGMREARYAEASRIEFLLQRDGTAATLIWVCRTLAIYRRSVLDPRHFAHTSEYRLKFVASCLEFRRWLSANGGYASWGTASPHSPV